MSCRISLWRSKHGEWRIDLFGVWRQRVSLGKCVNVSMSVKRGRGVGGARWNRSEIGLRNEPNHLRDETDYTRKKKTTTTQGLSKVSSKAGWHKSKKTKTKQTHFSFCLTYFRLQMTKTLKELEESKSNRQVCLTVSWIHVEAEAPHHIKPCKFSRKLFLSL